MSKRKHTIIKRSPRGMAQKEQQIVKASRKKIGKKYEEYRAPTPKSLFFVTILC